MGGSVSAIEQQFIQNEIAHSAYEFQQKLEKNEKIVVGVNKFQQEKDAAVPHFRINDSIREQQTHKLNVLKSRRDAGKVSSSLEEIRNKTVNGENIMPAVVEAVENYCTLGEVADVLRNIFGEYR
jgi:methylmalonyl-CoA mutase N-terminal domain/subunit